MGPIGGAGVSIRVGGAININIGGGAGAGAPLGGAGQGGGCCCKCPGDGFSPSSELMGGRGGQGLGIGGLPTGPALTQLMNQLANSPMQLGGINPANALPASIMLGGGGVPGSIMDQGGIPPMPMGGGGSLTSQALMMQAASSDANQASLIMAQSGAMTGLAGAQGMALAGAVDTLSMGLMGNYMT